MKMKKIEDRKIVSISHRASLDRASRVARRRDEFSR
jgi:hypothetical protein